MRGVLWWIVPAFLFGAALYEFVLAVRGDTYPNTLAFVAILVMLLGAGLAALSIRFEPPLRAIAFYAPSAAAFVLARLYTYDEYFSPTARRYAENVSVPWMIALVAAALAVGVLAWRIPRTGAVGTVIMLPFVAAATIAMGLH